MEPLILPIKRKASFAQIELMISSVCFSILKQKIIIKIRIRNKNNDKEEIIIIKRIMIVINGKIIRIRIIKIITLNTARS
jgi:hypothetical protein